MSVVDVMVSWISLSFVTSKMENRYEIGQFQETILCIKLLCIVIGMGANAVFLGFIEDGATGEKALLTEIDSKTEYKFNPYANKYFQRSQLKSWLFIILVTLCCHDAIVIIYLLSSNLFGSDLFYSGLHNRELYLLHKPYRFVFSARCFLVGFLQLFFAFYVSVHYSVPYELLTIPIVASITTSIFLLI